MNIYTLLLFSGHALASKSASGPDVPYGLICFEYLNYAYSFPGGCGKNGTCLCTDPTFMLTELSCVNEILDWENAETAQRHSSLALVSQLCNVDMTTIEEYSNNSTNLSAYSGNAVYANFGFWQVTEAFKPGIMDIEHGFETYYGQAVRSSSQRFGASLLAYWGGVLLLHAIFHFWKRFVPNSFNKLVNSKYGRIWRKYLTLTTFTTYSPSNLLTLEMIGFFILSMVETFAGYPIVSDHSNFLFKKSRAYSMFCGSRSGYLALYIAPLMILFAGRNNFLQGLSGLSYNRYVYYHRWVARIEVLLLFIHAIAYTITMLVGHTYNSAWSQAYWNWGIVSLAFGCFMVVQGARWIRKRAYETFIVFHIIAVVFFIVGGYYHIYKIHEPKGLGFFYAMIAVWGFDRAARLLRISVSNFGQKAILKSDCDTLTITAPFPKWWKLKTNPGTYTYIHFLNKQHFHQSHPFTMYLNPDNTDELKLICRVKNGVTKTMDNLIAKNNGVFETRICLDGPYGHSLNLQLFDELVFVAGGVGITTVFSYAQNLLLSDNKKDQHIKIFWAVRDSSAELWYETELEFLRSHFTVEVNLYIGDGTVEKQEPLNVGTEIKNVIENASGSVGVLCCGPRGMAEDTKNGVAANLHLTSHYVDYFS